MNEIWDIQDYRNRLFDYQMKHFHPEKKKFTDKNSDLSSQKSFEEYLKSEISPYISGKVSSEQIFVPRNIQKEIQNDPYKKKLYDASVEFESIFVKIMLSEMKKTVHKNKMIYGGYAEEIFEDFLTDEQAKQISKNDSIGLAEQIYITMSKSL